MLLPPELEQRRAVVPVVDSLPVKGLPGRTLMSRHLRTVTNIYERTGVLAHIGFAPDEGYVLIDKGNPHALNELMVMSAGPTMRPGLHDHSAAFGMALGALVACFAAHCADFDLYPVVSWSYDPSTRDRPWIQGEKRFHAHLIGRTAAERAVVAQRAVRAADLAPQRRRRIVEEASVLAVLVASDCVDVDALRVLEPVPPMSTGASTATIQYRVRGGWEAFAGPDLHADLVYLDRKLHRVYGAIMAACGTGRSGPWERPVMDADRLKDVQLPLGDAARAVVHGYLSGMGRRLLGYPGVLRGSRARAIHLYPLAGLAYSMAFAEQDGDLHAHVRVNVFSDLGGAGVTQIDGTTVKIKKGVGVAREDEVAARAAFQCVYLSRLRHHPLAGRALFPSAKVS